MPARMPPWVRAWCRLDRRWLCSNVVTSAEPFEAVWDLAGAMRNDATGSALADALPEPVREALAATLLSLADNKRVLGMRYGEWILGAPTLEAGIACSAMAQDEWGHARILYATLKEFEFEPNVLEHERPAD